MHYFRIIEYTFYDLISMHVIHIKYHYSTIRFMLFYLGFTNMDNHGYDGQEAKPKNNNTYTDPSMTNGSLQGGWSNGGPG